MNWFILCVTKNYAKFSGRARRKEYWMFKSLVLFCFIIAAKISDGFLDLLAIALFFPILSAIVRRLHDISKSGWWVLIGLIPIIGCIILLFFMVQDSTPGSNQYGDNPKDYE